MEIVHSILFEKKRSAVVFSFPQYGSHCLKVIFNFLRWPESSDAQNILCKSDRNLQSIYIYLLFIFIFVFS